MRILFITNRLPYPLNDGGNIATYNNILHLKKKGHRVDLLSFNTKKHFVDPAPLAEIVNVHAVEIDTQVTFKGAALNLMSRLPYNISRFQDEHFSKVLTHILTQKEFDIIQIEGSYMGIYLKQIRELSDAKVVLRAHNVEYKIWDRISNSESDALKSIYVKYLKSGIEKFEKDIAKKFDGIIPITNVDGDFFTEQAAKVPIQVIPAGVDLETFSTNGSSEANSLFMIGNLQWMPNLQSIDWFLENAWSKVKSAFPSATLHIAGKNPPKRILDLKVDGLTVHGMVDSALDFMNAYSIMLVPLLSGSGMRIKIIEGMAARKCILSTPIGAEGIDAKNGDEIVIASPDTFADELIKLLNDPTLVGEIGANARTFVEANYSWNSLIKEFESFYRQLV